VVRFKDSRLEGTGYREGEAGRRHLNGGKGREVERRRVACQTVAGRGMVARCRSVAAAVGEALPLLEEGDDPSWAELGLKAKGC
jgi:hypothetical protein